MATEPVAPVRAATVVLFRGGVEELELLLVKRHSRSGFMANMFVFPGGKVDAADVDASGPDDELAAVRRAVLRECVEEAGLLLARGPDGAWASGAQAARVREGCLTGGGDFARELAAEGLTLVEHEICAFARWVTPVVETRRFDTWFWLAAAPEGQVATVDQREITQLCWMRPEAALRAYAARELELSPPTFYMVETFAGLAAGAVDPMTWAADQSLRPVLPVLELGSEPPRLLLPGDPEYATDWPVTGPTRLELREGRWVSSRPGGRR